MNGRVARKMRQEVRRALKADTQRTIEEFKQVVRSFSLKERIFLAWRILRKSL